MILIESIIEFVVGISLLVAVSYGVDRLWNKIKK